MAWRMFRRNSSKVRLAIMVKPNQIRLVRVQNGVTDVSDSESCQGSEHWLNTLKLLQQRNQLSAEPVNVVLHPLLYQSLAVDKPAVADDEIASSLPFALRDMVNDNINELALDYYHCPVSPGAAPRVNAVAVRRNLLQQLIDACQGVGFTPQKISIEELALADLLGVNQESQMLVYHSKGQDVLALVVREGMLCFSRRLRGFTQLMGSPTAEDRSFMLESLALELQRSADYVVSQLKLSEVAHIHLIVDAEPALNYQADLAELLAIPLTNFAPEGLSVKHNADWPLVGCLSGVLHD